MALTWKKQTKGLQGEIYSLKYIVKDGNKFEEVWSDDSRWEEDEGEREKERISEREGGMEKRWRSK